MISFEMLLGSFMFVKVLGDGRGGDLYLEVAFQPIVEALCRVKSNNNVTGTRWLGQMIMLPGLPPPFFDFQ